MYQKKSIALSPQVPVTVNFLSKLSPDTRRNVFRSMVLLAVNALEGEDIPEGALDNVQVPGMSTAQLYESYAGLLSLIQMFLKLPQGSVSPDLLKEELQEAKFPAECSTDLLNILCGPKRQVLDESISRDQFYMKVEKFRWRVDITISSSILSRVLEPSIIFDMVLSNGDRKIFEVSISKFHQIRYSVATVLKEMELMEKKKLFKN